MCCFSRPCMQSHLHLPGLTLACIWCVSQLANVNATIDPNAASSSTVELLHAFPKLATSRATSHATSHATSLATSLGFEGSKVESPLSDPTTLIGSTVTPLLGDHVKPLAMKTSSEPPHASSARAWLLWLGGMLPSLGSGEVSIESAEVSSRGSRCGV